jgi:antitoxin component of MazEF toxin-antitoxin module
MLAVPPAVLKTLELSTDSEVGMTINNGCLIIEPQKRPHYSLEELLAQCDPHAEMSEEERNGFMRLRWAGDPVNGQREISLFHWIRLLATSKVGNVRFLSYRRHRLTS